MIFALVLKKGLNMLVKNIENIVSFRSAPPNYKIIDNFVSRSAQPNEENLSWLKKEGVTDVFNFRTMSRPDISFNEEEVCKTNGIKYHQIPLRTRFLNEENEKEILPVIKKIFETIEQIKKIGGKIHWHCKEGLDRTGFVSLIYKSINGIDSFEKNSQEMIDMGHHKNVYPNMINKAEKISKIFK